MYIRANGAIPPYLGFAPAAASVSAVAVAELGVATFQALQPIIEKAFLDGKVIFSSTRASYKHANSRRDRPYRKAVYRFKIIAKYPSGLNPGLVFGAQEFWFELSYSFNGNDLDDVGIIFLPGASSLVSSSKFEIRFEPEKASGERDPIAKIRFALSGTWDPLGYGIAGFSGSLVLDATGIRPQLNIRSENNMVIAGGFVPVTPPVPFVRPSRPLRSGTQSRPTLRLCSSGPAVLELKQRLNQWLVQQGRPPLKVDSIFDCPTDAAVREFQSRMGLTVDGIVGLSTWSRLSSLATTTFV